MNLQKIKERVAKYKEEIDEADEREQTAKTALIEAESREEKTKDEVDGLKRRFVLLKEDLVKTRERIEANQKKLENAEGRHINDDERRQEFEASEIERDDTLIQMEEECLTAKKLKDEAHLVLVESERKLQVLEGDLQRANERVGTWQSRVDSLENRVNGVAEEIRDLEGRDWEAAEREILSGEKLKFLEDQLREVTESSEGQEREVRKLEDLIGGYDNEINSWTAKAKVIRDECREIESLADAQLDEHSTERHAAKPEPEPEHHEEEEEE